jgi:hypothetical protein
MPNKNHKKGRALEKAVFLIQEAILKADPKLNGVKFSIEANKIVSVAGVHHEIDILVKTLPGSAYESTCLFECKNWNKPVGKNEASILADKVNALGATRGFLVAREFTKDCEARVRADSRLSMVVCKDDFLSSLTIELRHVIHEPTPIRILIKHYGIPAAMTPRILDWKRAKFNLSGSLSAFFPYVMNLVKETAEKDRKNNSGKYLLESTHFIQQSMLVEFDRFEFFVNDLEVEHIRIDVEFWVNVLKYKMVSKFEIEGQGRVFSFEPANPVAPENQFEFQIVTLI